jgi:hypothetical protein
MTTGGATLNAEAVADHTSYIPAESVTGPAGAVYQKQLAFEQAKRTYERELWALAEDYDRQRAAGHMVLADAYDAPHIRTLRKEMEAARIPMEQAQAEIGGIVMSIETEANLPKAIKRMESLSKRAVKLGLDPITLKVTDETVVLNYAYAYDYDRAFHADFLHTYCILSGGTPKVEGFHFLASIEHTPAGNLVKKVPVLSAQMRGLVATGPEDKAAEALEAIDVERYRSVDPVCDHCGLIRSRKDTYLVYNNETGEIKQVGRTCLRDYTGADNPEAIVKFLEHYFEAMRPNNTERPKPVVRTRDFLAHVAAAGLGANGEYVKGETKDWALTNYFNRLEQKMESTRSGGKVPAWIEPTETHYQVADQMIDWALNTWTATNDFALNVKTAIANEVVPNKAYGIVAAVFAAKQRWDGQEAARKVEADKPESNWIGQPKERIEFTATVTQKQYRGEDDYGKDKWLVKLHDADGNEIIWWTTGEMRVQGESDTPYVEEGNTYRIKATVKEHTDHERFGKSTKITRASFLYQTKES